MTAPSNIHIGSEIRLRVEQNGMTVVHLARLLCCSRTNIYKIYERPSIDTALLQRLSRILDYDFFKLYQGEKP